MIDDLPYDIFEKVPFTRFDGPDGSKLYLVHTMQEWRAFYSVLMTKKLVSCDTETQGFHWFKGHRIVGMSFGWQDTHFYVPVRHESSALGGQVLPQLDMDDIRGDLQAFFSQTDVFTIWFNAKFDMNFYRADDIEVTTPFHDASILWQLFDENAPGALKTIASGWTDPMLGKQHPGIVGPEANEYEKALSKWRGQEATERRKQFRRRLIARAEELSSKIEHQNKTKTELKKWISKNELDDDPWKNASKSDVHYGVLPIPTMVKYAATDTFLTWRVYEHVISNLSFSQELTDLYVNELKLSRALQEAEWTGVKIDRKYLEDLADELAEEVNILTAAILDELGDLNLNLNSPTQLGNTLVVAGVPLTEKTPTGYYKTSAEILKKFKDEFTVVERILELRAVTKIRQTYVIGILEKLTDDDILHCQFNQNVSTGRMCIAKGTLVQTPCDRSIYPNGKPIEDIKVGDKVYCYDNDGNLYLREVKDAVNKGVKETVTINWVGQGNKHSGSLTCTPDHRIRLFDGTWVEARDLQENDRIMALSSSVKGPDHDQYVYLYGRYSSSIREHQFVAGSLGLKGKVTHHIDENKLNNSIDNLGVISASEHASEHIKTIPQEVLRERAKSLHTPDARKRQLASIKSGPENPCWKSLNKISLLRLAAKHKGRIRRMIDDLSCDFTWLHRNLSEAGIDLQKVRALYNKEGTYLSRRVVREASEGGIPEMQKALKVGYYKAKKLLAYYDLETNHRVVSVVQGPSVPVYDLEVEEFNNFIAGELCVHNSSSDPNLQNIPGRDTRIRQAFICPSDDFVFVFIDYSQVEVRLTAHYSQDPLLLEAYKRGQDVHTRTMCEMFGFNYDEVNSVLAAKDKSHPRFKEWDLLRTVAKRINFGIIYGVGAPGLSGQIPRPEHFINLDETEWIAECQDYIDRYMHKYVGVKRFINSSGREVRKNAQVVNHFGRIRRLPWAKADKILGPHKFWMVGKAKRQGTNFIVQGTAADLFKIAVVRVFGRLKECKSKIVNLVHDEIQLYMHRDELYLLNEIRDLMEDFGFSVPIKVDVACSTTSWAEKKELG